MIISDINDMAFLRLLQLSDPALPIGGFSHSAGLETYVQAGVVRDIISAKKFIGQMLQQSVRYTDGMPVSLAYDAAVNNDASEIWRLDDECSAIKIPMEMRQASNKLGVRLMKIFLPLHPNELINAYQLAIQRNELTGHYSIIFGMYAHALGIQKQKALLAFYYNSTAAMITNCVKLVPLSQQAGQHLLFELQDDIAALAQATMQPDKTLLGLCCSAFDIRSMQHERLYTRLYMS